MDPYSAGALATFQVLSGLQQADMIRQNAALNRDIMRLNQEYAEMDAYEAMKQGISEEARYSGTIQSVLSSQNAAFAAKDIDRTFGTASEIQAETKLVGFLNQLKIKNNTSAKVLGYKRQALNYGLQNSMNQTAAAQQASAAQTAGLIRGGATFASGYNSYSAKTEGVNDTSTGPSSAGTGSKSYQSPIDYTY